MKKEIFFLMCFFIMLCACDQITGQKKIGDANVSYLSGELLADNFPRYSQGVVGINQISWGSFSFDKLDEYAYNIARSESSGIIYISIRYIDKDRYGNAIEGNRITIGYIDVEETKKYADYDNWHRYNSTFKMWRKDYAEYDRQTKEEGQGQLYYVSKSYEPKSIR